MPKDEKMVDLDTSGEGAEVNIEEQKDESVVNTEAPKEGLEAPKRNKKTTEQETVKRRNEPKQEDDNELKNIVKVFKLELQNSHVKCVKLRGEEMQPLNMQNQLKETSSNGKTFGQN